MIGWLLHIRVRYGSGDLHSGLYSKSLEINVIAHRLFSKVGSPKPTISMLCVAYNGFVGSLNNGMSLLILLLSIVSVVLFFTYNGWEMTLGYKSLYG